MTDMLTPETQTAQIGEKPDPLAQKREFFEALRRLYTTDRGRLAILKRNAGNHLAEARGDITWFFDYLRRYAHVRPDSREEEIYFLAATLFASDKNALLKGLSGSGDLGRTFRQASGGAKASEQDPVERRLAILLDASFDPDGGGEMAFRLRQAVKFVLSKPESRIDWPKLLDDLLQWDRPDKRVQKRWARSFYAVPEPASTDGMTDTNTAPQAQA